MKSRTPTPTTSILPLETWWMRWRMLTCAQWHGPRSGSCHVRPSRWHTLWWASPSYTLTDWRLSSGMTMGRSTQVVRVMDWPRWRCGRIPSARTTSSRWPDQALIAGPKPRRRRCSEGTRHLTRSEALTNCAWSEWVVFFGQQRFGGEDRSGKWCRQWSAHQWQCRTRPHLHRP